MGSESAAAFSIAMSLGVKTDSAGRALLERVLRNQKVLRQARAKYADEQRQHRDEFCAKYMASFEEFVKGAWPVIQPTTPLIWNWHMTEISRHIQALLTGKLGDFQNLALNVPPGTSKSTIASVCVIPWVWLHAPSWRGLFASGTEKIAFRDSMYARDIVSSQWYQEMFQPKWTFDKQDAKGHYINSETGWRQAITCGAGIMGQRADGIAVDDPNEPDDAGEAQWLRINSWWDAKAANRLSTMQLEFITPKEPTQLPIARGIRWLIQQRVNVQDLTGHVIERERSHWAFVVIRQEFEQPLNSDPDFEPTPLGWKDSRQPGELLFEKRFPRRVVDYEKRRMGSHVYNGQHQQRPTALSGGVWLRHWWRYWKPADMKLPAVQVRLADGSAVEIDAVSLPSSFDEEAMSWDMAFKDFKDSDFVAGGHWGRVGANKFLIDQVHEQLSFTQTVEAVRTMTQRAPRAVAKYIEDKANGTAVMDTLRNEISGMIPIEPEGGKFARANAVSPQMEAGNVFLPHPAIAPWVNDFVEECASFPNGRHDDWVDMTSQMLNRWANNSFGSLYRHVMTADILYDDSTRPIGLHSKGGHQEHWIVVFVSATHHFYVDVYDNGDTVFFDAEKFHDARRDQQKGDMEHTMDLIAGDGVEWNGLGMDERTRPGVIIDPSVVSLRTQLQQARVWIVDAENASDDIKADGVRRVATMLEKGKLKIHQRCRNLRREMETWTLDDIKTAPDVCRLFVSTRINNWRLGI